MVYVSGNILERAGKLFLVSSDMRLLMALMFIFGRTGCVGRGILKRYLFPSLDILAQKKMLL